MNTSLRKRKRVILTKYDLSAIEKAESIRKHFKSQGITTFVISAETGDGIDELKKALSYTLSKAKNIK